MSRFYVLIPPGGRDPEMNTLFVRDGFSWLGLLLPLPWLIFRRLWIISAITLLLYFLVSFAADFFNLDMLPFAYSVVLGLWVGIEGGHVRAQMLMQKGWRLDDVILAPTLADAEEAYFADRAERDEPQDSSFEFPRETAGFDRGRNTAALGLIGPYGGQT